jgi:hypothetical protein
MRLDAAAAMTLALATGSCTSSDSSASLDVALSSSTVTGAQSVKVNLTATNADGTVGVGSVQVQSSAGSLTTPVTLTLDPYGLAQTTLTPEYVTNMCSSSIQVTATWQPPSGDALNAESTLKVLTPGFDAGAPTPNALSPIDALCSTDAGVMTVYPDAGPLLPDDVPGNCANGFEVNNPKNRGVYTLASTLASGSRAITLDVDLATYKVPDRVSITGLDGCGNTYLLLSSEGGRLVRLQRRHLRGLQRLAAGTLRKTSTRAHGNEGRKGGRRRNQGARSSHASAAIFQPREVFTSWKCLFPPPSNGTPSSVPDFL